MPEERVDVLRRDIVALAAALPRRTQREPHRLLELSRRDCARLVGVDVLEGFPQLRKHIRRRGEGDHLERHLFDVVGAGEGLQRGEHRGVPLLRLASVDFLGRASEPGVLEGLGGRDPLLRVLLEERGDEVDALRGDVVPLGAREGHRRLADHPGLDGAILVVEGALPRQQHVRDYAHRPEVDGRVVLDLMVRPKLRRHVRRRANLLAHAAVPAAVALMRKPKVNHLELGVIALVLVDEVVQLDVAVDHAALVAVQRRRQHLLDQLACRRLSVAVPVPLHPRHERAAAAQLHHNVQLVPPLLLEPLVQLHDVRVVERALHLDLLPQLLHRLTAHVVQRDRLHREELAG
mmetsp:Transcript_45860/g.147711  ORF Transcript_45860/g.147711 Transcript_45860/m.147711 type:complete len:348 (-) Transcript_45860:311-1354(-)